MHRGHTQQRRGHDRRAFNRIHKTHKTENAAQQHAGHRPDDDCANSDRHGQKRHIQRPDRHAAQTNEFHHHFNGYKDRELRQRLHADLLFRLGIHF